MSDAGLERATVERLRSLEALKSGALGMFDPMLAEVARERDDRATAAEVADLLRRMHERFSAHRGETAAHAERIRARLAELGAAPAERRARGLALAARSWVRVGSLGGQNHGANARNAFVFEHLEIASLRLLEELGERAGDAATAELARACRAEDEEMAATIDRNWANVLTLALAG